MFCIVGDDGVSDWFQLSTKLCVFSTHVQKKRAGRQDEAFSLQESLFQTQSFCCDWQPLNLEFAVPDSYFKSLGATVLSTQPRGDKDTDTKVILHWSVLQKIVKKDYEQKK